MNKKIARWRERLEKGPCDLPHAKSGRKVNASECSEPVGEIGAQ